MADHKFTGNDRRLLTLAVKLAAAIERRDARAADPTPAKGLSTRLLVIDPDAPLVPEAFTTLQTHLAGLLAATS